MIASMAIKSFAAKLLKSRGGLAIIVAVVAAVVIGALSWQIRTIKDDLREEMLRSAQLQTQNQALEGLADQLEASIKKQNERIQALQRQAKTAEQRAEAAAIKAAATPEQWGQIETAPAGHKEMNRWLSDLLSP